VERVGRGEYAISGNIEFKYTPEDNTMVNMYKWNKHNYLFIPKDMVKNVKN